MNKFSDNLKETNALIEQHIHGGFGIDFAKCNAREYLEFSKKIIKYGVCAFFPTLATDTVDNLKRQIEEIKSAIKLQESEAEPMAKILGIHLEACFINPAKKGIHDENQLLKPSIENYSKLEDEAIKIVTLAPELDENNELCKYLKSKGVRVSAGHCLATDLSHVDQVTHLYNAMGNFSHREPSTAVSALAKDEIEKMIVSLRFSASIVRIQSISLETVIVALPVYPKAASNVFVSVPLLKLVKAENAFSVIDCMTAFSSPTSSN